MAKRSFGYLANPPKAPAIGDPTSTTGSGGAIGDLSQSDVQTINNIRAKLTEENPSLVGTPQLEIMIDKKIKRELGGN
jgi:hypothetical protein